MNGNLLQSDGWERFQRALGRKVERIGGVLAIEMPLPFGMCYWYSPRSAADSRQPIADSIIGSVPKTGTIFWRAEFGGQVSGVRCQVSEPRVLRRAVEPEWTWRTSLEGSDDERMAAMHEKHRYNVRLAAKRGVAVRAASAKLQAASKDFETCWRLLQETAQRQEISTHPRHYYETMLRTLPNVRLYIVERDGVPLATAIVAYHGDTATYLHGGSSYEHRALMAPHLLHWQAMRDAKAAGMRWYDWAGINPEIPDSRFSARGGSAFGGQTPDSRWDGMTRFKQSFGGEAVHHPPTRDLVFRRGWYAVLSALATMRVGR